MAVKVVLTNGERRVVDDADGAHLDGEFFVITRWSPDLQRAKTVLTLWAPNVVGAHVEKDGVTEWVPGTGRVQNGGDGAASRGVSKA